MLVEQKEMTEKGIQGVKCVKLIIKKILESIQKETELDEEERLARKQASELGQIDDAGEREVQECAADLEFALEELDLAKDAAKKFARKKEGTAFQNIPMKKQKMASGKYLYYQLDGNLFHFEFLYKLHYHLHQ